MYVYFHLPISDIGCVAIDFGIKMTENGLFCTIA